MDLRRPDSGFYTPDPIIHLRQTGTASAHTAEGQKPEADSVKDFLMVYHLKVENLSIMI